MVFQKICFGHTANKIIKKSVHFLELSLDQVVFSEVTEWFNDENATSLALSSSELIFGLNRKNQRSSEIFKTCSFI